jgi:hypothetical protein
MLYASVVFERALESRRREAARPRWGVARFGSAWAFPILLTLVYVAVAAFATIKHEMWRDELHCWLVARDSATPWQVVRARAYDGQPPLWYLLLWALTRATWHPEAMRAVHLAIAAADVVLFGRFAPFGRFARVLFAFGYFVVYEYAALSRCYGLALLFVLLLCIHHGKRLQGPVVTGLLLGALALTTTVGALVAAAYTVALVVEWSAELRREARWPPRSRAALTAVALAALGGAAAGLCAWPPSDSTVARVGTPPIMPWDFASTRIIAGLLPIPRVDFFFWNSNALLDAIPVASGRFALAVVLFVWVLLVVSGDRFASMVFAVGTALLVGLFSGVYSGSVRHHGFIYVLFVMASWIAKEASARSAPLATRRPWQDIRTRALGVTFTTVLMAHWPGAIIAIAFDTRYIFSSGGRAARALQTRGLAEALLVAEVDYPATAMLGQLGPRAMAYSPRTGRPFSFVRWTRDRSWDPTDEETLAFTSALGHERGEDAVLVMNRPLLPELIDGRRVVRIAELYDSMIEEENFYLYRVARSAPQ